ncbi:phosphate ABC transporter ATP-binding protein PstB [Nannocystaceae bacterium ST9]
MRAVDVSVRYGKKLALREVSLDVPARQITALIGPSGCGKSTFLRCINRMHDSTEACVVSGSITLDGMEILAPNTDVVALRRRVGMVFQKPNPFPKSVFDNVAFGLRVGERLDRADLAERVERALRGAALWDEVKDRLGESATALSGGQQQRLCIARALAMQPQVLLLDEPTSALDPIATAHIEELLRGLADRVTPIIVTHNMQQARRISARVAFFYLGELVEVAATDALFGHPSDVRTREYVSGAFG